MQKKKIRGFLEHPKTIIAIFLVLALIMISSALFELQQSKSELLDLMEQQSHSLLESIIIASRNALRINESLEAENRTRLLNNAHFIKILYENGQVTNDLLAELGKKNQIYRINIFTRDGKKAYSNHPSQHTDPSGQIMAEDILQPIFQGEIDTLIIGFKSARARKQYRYAIALAAKNRSAIVLNIDAEKLINLRRDTGFGSLMRDIIKKSGIVYVALQDTSGILAASGNVSELESLQDSPILKKAYSEKIFMTRITLFDSIEVFEAVHPFVYEEIPVGIVRLGLSLDPVSDINARILRRLIVITIVLILIGSFILIYLFFRQRYAILENQYQIVETYSSDIIQNVSDAIIVYDQSKGIKIANREAGKIFKFDHTRSAGKTIDSTLSDLCPEIITMPKGMQQFDCQIQNKQKHLLIAKNFFQDKDDIQNVILVIRDLTRQKQLESQIQRNERLTAMGELASGVAHEIRNPLNTIGTIVQQLDKDFESVENKQEYHELAQLVYKEVKRINDTVKEFLRFARPEPINPSRFYLSEFFNPLIQQYSALLKERNIHFDVQLRWKGEVFWDYNQIKQVFINLMQNALDALKTNDKISLDIQQLSDKEIEINFEDNGPGIPDAIKDKIFNLYFTTKAQGTGLGLSIVQRILYEHHGVISLQNSSKGTHFRIIMPKQVLHKGQLDG